MASVDLSLSKGDDAGESLDDTAGPRRRTTRRKKIAQTIVREQQRQYDWLDRRTETIDRAMTRAARGPRVARLGRVELDEEPLRDGGGRCCGCCC